MIIPGSGRTEYNILNAVKQTAVPSTCVFENLNKESAHHKIIPA